MGNFHNINNSTVIQSNGSNVNINSGNSNNANKAHTDYDETLERLNQKIKGLKEEKLIVLYHIEELINEASEVFVEIASKSTELKDYLKEKREIRSMISLIKTLEETTERKFNYNKKFLEYFAEIDFSNKSYKENDKI